MMRDLSTEAKAEVEARMTINDGRRPNDGADALLYSEPQEMLSAFQFNEGLISFTTSSV
jgi:hypothetical protein